MDKVLVLLIPILVVACTTMYVRPIKNCNMVKNSWDQQVSLKKPLIFKVTDTYPKEWIPIIQKAASNWHTNLLVVESDVTDYHNLTQNDSFIFLNTEWDGLPLEQAKTTIHWMGPEIRKAAIAINGKNCISTTLKKDCIDLESLLTHEFGHALGFNHVNDKPSVMAPTLFTQYLRNKLFEIDVHNYLCAYGDTND